MKKIITLFSLIGILSIAFLGCKKDSEEGATNYVKIEGTFTVGVKEYVNPTFDFGTPEDSEAELYTAIGKKTFNGITIVPVQEFDLGDSNYLMFYIDINSAEVGPAQMYLNIRISSNYEKVGLYISSDAVDVNITKIGDVGEYIEGTYEGDLYNATKKQDLPYHVKGKFKVKRYESINNIK